MSKTLEQIKEELEKKAQKLVEAATNVQKNGGGMFQIKKDKNDKPKQ